MVSAEDYRVVLSIDYYTRRLAIVRNRLQRYKYFLKWQKTRFLHFKITYIPIFLLQTPTNFAILHKKTAFHV